MNKDINLKMTALMIIESDKPALGVSKTSKLQYHYQFFLMLMKRRKSIMKKYQSMDFNKIAEMPNILVGEISKILGVTNDIVYMNLVPNKLMEIATAIFILPTEITDETYKQLKSMENQIEELNVMSIVVAKKDRSFVEAFISYDDLPNGQVLFDVIKNLREENGMSL